MVKREGSGATEFRENLRQSLENPHYPTQREIAAAMGLRTTTAATYLEPLEKKGVVARAGRGHRNVRITEQGVRVLGRMGVSTSGLQLEL